MKEWSRVVGSVSLALLALYWTSFCAASSARAEYTDKPITVFISYAAGGSSDMSFRALAVGAENPASTALITTARITTDV